MNNIILMGFMGSGKSSFGMWIKKHTDMRFVDTDELIVEHEKMSINDIFAAKGEEYFRELETKTLKSLVKKNLKNYVISLGGGTPIREKNKELLKQLGTVVYLRASVESLVNRLENDTKRPLLAGEDLESRIRELFSKRETIYEDRANLIIDTDNLDFKQMYERIKEYENSSN